MKKFIPILIVFIILSSGCLGNSVKFKECKLDYSKIKENQMTHLWIDIENTGEIAKEVHVLFLYPETVTIESRGKKTTGFNVTVEPDGATSGRKSFILYGDYIAGQPSSPWDIIIQMYSGKELLEEKILTVTVIPP